jgi:hypothetical protein
MNMSFLSSDLESILIVLVFLGTLLVVRQIIVTKANSIKKTLGTHDQRIQLLEVYRVEKTLKLSLLDIEGNRVAVLHGAGRHTALLRLEGAPAEKRVPDA